MIKFILLDLYNVLYFPREERVNDEIVELLKGHNAEYGFGLLSAVRIDLEAWLENHELKKYFQFVKTTEQLDMSKTEPDVYEMVANSFELKPNEVLFIDDLAENVTAAKKAGLQTLRYASNKPLVSQLKDLGILV